MQHAREIDLGKRRIGILFLVMAGLLAANIGLMNRAGLIVFQSNRELAQRIEVVGQWEDVLSRGVSFGSEGLVPQSRAAGRARTERGFYD